MDPLAHPCSRVRSHRRIPDRLAGWLRWYVWRYPSKVWIRFDAKRLAGILGCSERSVWRAKQYLMIHSAYYGLEWVTVRAEDHWECLFASSANLKYDRLPLLFSKSGKCRRVKGWYRSKDLLRTGLLKPVTVTDNLNTIRRKPAERSLNGDSAPPQADGKRAGRSAPSPFLDSKKLRKGQRFPWTNKNNRYVHALCRALQEMHWDNCKVIYHHPSCVAVVRSLLQDGETPRRIMSRYYSSLIESHGIATDLGLECGNPRMMIHPSRLYKLLYNWFGYVACDTSKGRMYVKIHGLD